MLKLCDSHCAMCPFSKVGEGLCSRYTWSGNSHCATCAVREVHSYQLPVLTLARECIIANQRPHMAVTAHISGQYLYLTEHYDTIVTAVMGAWLLRFYAFFNDTKMHPEKEVMSAFPAFVSAYFIFRHGTCPQRVLAGRGADGPHDQR